MITVTGQKTGTVYRIPVGYRQDDDALLVATIATWRRKLRPGAPVTVLLRGRCYSATAEVITDEQRCAELYRGILARNPVNGNASVSRLAPMAGRTWPTCDKRSPAGLPS